MASFDIASKKQLETNPQDFVHLCFRFAETDITVLEIVTPEQPTVEMHQADSGKFEQNLERHNISIEYQVFRLIDIDGQKILDSRLSGLIPFTPLMKHQADTSDEQWLRKCVQVANSIAVPNKAEYLGSLAILGNLIYDSQTLLNIISEETMQHPSITEYTAPLARELGFKQATRKSILEALELRLGDDIAQTFKTTVESIDDLQRLELLFRAAVKAENADEFGQALNEETE